MSASPNRSLVVATVAGLLLALFLQLLGAAMRNSATFDEPAHMYTGYLQWAHGHYTLNPPLGRAILAAPLIGMQLSEPGRGSQEVRMHEMLGGKDFLLKNDTETILFRSRMTVVALAIILAVLVFVATRRMFGTGAGLIALGLLAFDPTLIAHSSLATTDTAQALLIFWAVYAFYAYVKRPALWRLAAVGVITGLAFSAKTSAVLLLPTFVLLAVLELVRGRAWGQGPEMGPVWKRAVRYAGVLAVIGVVAVVILWGTYGFRYVPADGGIRLVPDMAGKLEEVPGRFQAQLLGFVDAHRLLPQAYTYGFAHFLTEAASFNSFVFGTIYPHPVWFFFPVALIIKSSLTFLILLGITLWVAFRGKIGDRRALVYLIVPAAIYFGTSMAGGMNIGVRHILPVYVLLTAAIGGAVWTLVQEKRWLRNTVIALLVFQAASVLHAYPEYISYANELFGGPANVHRYLSDSSADWGQQLKSVKKYLDDRGIRESWFAYFGQGPLDLHAGGIRSTPLITLDAMFFDVPFDVPPSVDGTVLVSAGVLSGFEFGPPPLDPYEQFRSLAPVDVIDNGVFVYKGHFDLPLASALSHMHKAGLLLRAQHPDQALGEAQQALALAPESAPVQEMMGRVLDANDRREEATGHFEKALTIARTVQPAFQSGMVSGLEMRLANKRGPEK